MTQFGMGNMGFSAMMTIASQYLRGISEEDYLEFAEKLYTKHIAKLIYPETRALIEAHLKKGHTVALVTAATPYQVMPAARDLGIEHVKCSNLEIIDGKFTGSVVKPTCYGMGKVDAAEQLAEQHDVDISQSYFYSDSDEDIQLLEFVGNPRPLNPNKRLRRIASGRGWPVQDFNSRGNASVFDYLKTAATQMSMLTSFAAGLPIYALTGSLNKSRNFSTSLFADTACALTGIELDVEGEENAWANRPCVFVFNHQSQADVIILPALLRRDLAGIGKKEIGNVPILGKLMQIGGTVLIDRENAASALEAMKPLVDVLQKEGRSVCVAPEGTRSTSTHLGRFKKGAFHLAMQAGVPIVPIVIHNAIDVAPRGQYVFRPATVKVTVLPAVDTSQWSGATMNQHVEEVRDMFLEELDQMRFQISDQERKTTEERLKNLKRKEVAVAKRAKKTSAVSKISAAAKKLASPTTKVETKKPETKKPETKKPETKKPETKKPETKKPAASKNAVNGAKKASQTGPKASTAKPTTAPRRRSRKVSAAKVSARTLDN
jgi:putative phosphoserine phosphatase/1-acylglycerol-3-phosphate O-acyltransferase